VIGTVQELTDATFDEEVNGSPLPAIVDFWAEWCPPCETIAPILESIATDYSDRLRVFKINVDEHPLAARRFDVMSFPTLLIFRDGELVRRMIGARGRGHLLEELSEVVSL
jgi:thioredoxin 1